MIDPAIAKYWDSYTDEERRNLIAQSSKPNAIIIDHVGNVQRMAERYGLPDYPPVWTLDGREKRSSTAGSDAIPVRSCPQCTFVYERINNHCPECGYKPVPGVRSGPEHVDGDLIELDAAALARMRGAIDQVDMDPSLFMANTVSQYAPIGNQKLTRSHVERQQAIKALRYSIQWWGAWQRAANRDDSESYKRFYFRFGIDVGTAQTLKTKEALELADKVNQVLGEYANGSIKTA